ncbi:hypothetical protein F5Y09DRAFT_345941 [Xylaria sp. FL1042]|nr:hypothetical protein F5Y09DRAFT_345941 [Xylaria sp. FL1042]
MLPSLIFTPPSLAISIATVPNSEGLSPEELCQIVQRAQQLQAGSAVEADRLRAALRDVTPPLDEEEEREISRQLENEARRKLEAEGCPPCYPPDVDIHSSEELPDSCRAIVDYWLSFTCGEDVPLCYQLRAWSKFRAYQRRKRVRSFEDSERGACQRRQKYGSDDNVRLTIDLDQQSPLDRWIEYHDYQLEHLERLEKEDDRLRKELAESRSADDMDALQHIIGHSEKHIERHMVLLDWIEKERQLMRHASDLRVLSSRTGTVGQKTSPTRIHNAGPPKDSDIMPQKSTFQRRPQPRNTKKRDISRRSNNDLLLRRQLGLRRVTKRQHRSGGPALANRVETITRYGRRSKPVER